MSYVRSASFMLLIGGLAAITIVTFGQTDQLRTLLGDDAKGTAQREKLHDDSPIGKSRTIEADSNLRALYRLSKLEAAGTASFPDLSQLRQAALATSPPIPVGAPIADGGITLSSRRDSQILVACAKPTRQYLCLSWGTTGEKPSEAKGRALKAAQAEAVGGA